MKHPGVDRGGPTPSVPPLSLEGTSRSQTRARGGSNRSASARGRGRGGVAARAASGRFRRLPAIDSQLATEAFLDTVETALTPVEAASGDLPMRNSAQASAPNEGLAVTANDHAADTLPSCGATTGSTDHGHASGRPRAASVSGALPGLHPPPRPPSRGATLLSPAAPGTAQITRRDSFAGPSSSANLRVSQKPTESVGDMPDQGADPIDTQPSLMDATRDFSVPREEEAANLSLALTAGSSASLPRTVHQTGAEEAESPLTPIPETPPPAVRSEAPTPTRAGTASTATVRRGKSGKQKRRHSVSSTVSSPCSPGVKRSQAQKKKKGKAKATAEPAYPSPSPVAGPSSPPLQRSGLPSYPNRTCARGLGQAGDWALRGFPSSLRQPEPAYEMNRPAPIPGPSSGPLWAAELANMQFPLAADPWLPAQTQNHGAWGPVGYGLGPATADSGDTHREWNNFVAHFCAGGDDGPAGFGIPGPLTAPAALNVASTTGMFAQQQTQPPSGLPALPLPSPLEAPGLLPASGSLGQAIPIAIPQSAGPGMSAHDIPYLQYAQQMGWVPQPQAGTRYLPTQRDMVGISALQNSSNLRPWNTFAANYAREPQGSPSSEHGPSPTTGVNPRSAHQHHDVQASERRDDGADYDNAVLAGDDFLRNLLGLDFDGEAAPPGSAPAEAAQSGQQPQEPQRITTEGSTRTEPSHDFVVYSAHVPPLTFPAPTGAQVPAEDSGLNCSSSTHVSEENTLDCRESNPADAKAESNESPFCFPDDDINQFLTAKFIDLLLTPDDQPSSAFRAMQLELKGGKITILYEDTSV